MATTNILTTVQVPRAEGRVWAFLRKCTSFHVLMGTLLVGIDFIIELTFRIEPDTWWHTRLGETILATGHWPLVDTWSFTANGLPRVAYEWGGEVLLALAWRLAKLQGLEALLIGLTSGILLLIYYYALLGSCHKSAA